MATSAPSRANSTATARPMPESPPVTRADQAFELAAAAIVGRHEARRELEVGFEAGLGDGAAPAGFVGLLARAGLHRLGGFLPGLRLAASRSSCVRWMSRCLRAVVCALVWVVVVWVGLSRESLI